MSNWKITYVGEGVTALDGVGVFARHTTARVAEGVATKLKGDSKWVVTSPEGATTGTAPAPIIAAYSRTASGSPSSRSMSRIGRSAGCG